MADHTKPPRWWARADLSPPLDRHGFYDVGSSQGPFEPSPLSGGGAAPLSALRSTPCLVLLGPSGAGKTTLLEGERSELEARHERVRMVRGASVGSSTDLHGVLREVLDSQLSEQRESVTLFIDDIDQVRMDARAFGDSLIDGLEALPPGERARLRLRLACRSAAWGAYERLLTAFASLWTGTPAEVRRLLPLRRQDVATLVQVRLGLRARDFLDRLEAQPHALPFATTPQSLGMLMDLAENEELPRSAAALYQRACLELCAVRADDPPGGHTAEQRVAVASRLAVFEMLAPDGAANGSSARERDEEFRGQERPVLRDGSLGASFDVTPESVQDVVHGTGLFDGEGEGKHHRERWRHLSLAEFLAGWRLSRHPRPREVLPYLRQQAGTRSAIVPRMRGLASWLAVWSDEVREALWHEEPELLLACEHLELRSSELAKGVRALLDRVRRFEVLTWHVPHRGLEDVEAPRTALDALLRAARDPEEPTPVREAATRLLMALDASPVAPALAALALDATAPERVRLMAIHAVSRWGDDQTKAKLSPLATRREPDPVDPRDDLKGAALRALWPHGLTSSALFESLVPRRTPMYFGEYASFMLEVVGPALSALSSAELVGALDWAEPHFTDPTARESGLESLRDAVLDHAFARECDEEVTRRLAAVVCAAWSHHFSVRATVRSQGGRVAVPDARRRAVIEAIVEHLRDRAQLARASRLSEWVHPDDAAWLHERCRRATRDDEREVWCRLTRIAAPSPSAVERSGGVREGPRSGHEPPTEATRIHPQSTPRVPAPDSEPLARMRQARERAGERAAWRTLVHMGPDVTATPWWKASSEVTRREVQALAAAYLADPPPPPPSRAEDALPLDDLAGWAALVLLDRTEPERVEAMTSRQLGRWAVVLLAWLVRLGPAHEVQKRLAKRLEPARVAAVADAELRRARHHGHPMLLYHLPLVWSEQLCATLLRLLDQAALSLDDIATVAGLLASRGGEEATKRLAEIVERDAVASPQGADGGAHDARVARLGAALCRHDLTLWDRVWQVVTCRPELGWAFLAAIAHHVAPLPGVATLHLSLTEAQLEAAYMWTVEHGEGTPVGATATGAWVVPDGFVAEWRDRLLTTLRDRGTDAAVQALERIQRRWPEDDGLGYTLAAAVTRARSRERSWSAPTVSEVRSLLDHERIPRVADAGDLLDRTLEALDRLQQVFYGHGPERKCYWNFSSGNREPKRENACTEFLASHLEDKLRQGGTPGAKALREVALRESWAFGTGMTPDLVIVAPEVSDGQSRLVVECKREDHREVETALKDQLVRRYLDDPTLRHGLYVVYWFGRGTGPLGPDLDQAREWLEREARDVSTQSGKRVEARILDLSR